MGAGLQSLALHLSSARRCDAEVGWLLTASRCFCCFGKLVMDMEGAKMHGPSVARGSMLSVRSNRFTFPQARSLISS
jgi:hypothetical protein